MCVLYDFSVVFSTMAASEKKTLLRQISKVRWLYKITEACVCVCNISIILTKTFKAKNTFKRPFLAGPCWMKGRWRFWTVAGRIIYFFVMTCYYTFHTNDLIILTYRFYKHPLIPISLDNRGFTATNKNDYASWIIGFLFHSHFSRYCISMATIKTTLIQSMFCFSCYYAATCWEDWEIPDHTNPLPLLRDT